MNGSRCPLVAAKTQRQPLPEQRASSTRSRSVTGEKRFNQPLSVATETAALPRGQRASS